MNRRTFLKRCFQSIAGALALPFLPKSEAKNNVVVANGTDETQKWCPISNGKKKIRWRRWARLSEEPRSFTKTEIDEVIKAAHPELNYCTHPITENEIGPIESRFVRGWTEDGCRTVVRERKTYDGKIITDRAKLPEPAKMLQIYFGRVIAICENATYGEK